ARGGDQQAGLLRGAAVERLADLAEHPGREGDLRPEAPLLVELDPPRPPGAAVEEAGGRRRVLARLGVLEALAALEQPHGRRPWRGHDGARLAGDAAVALDRGRAPAAQPAGRP